MNSDGDTLLIQSGFSHSEISGSKLVCQLTEAYRRLLRPSSPYAAKASTTCAYSLDLITYNKLKIVHIKYLIGSQIKVTFIVSHRDT